MPAPKRLFKSLDIEIIDMFFFKGLMEKGEVLNRPDYLDQAYRIGLDLANYLHAKQKGDEA